MKIQHKRPHPTIGFTTERASAEDTTISICHKAFTCSDDGVSFYELVDNYFRDYAHDYRSHGVFADTTRLIIIQEDKFGNAVSYINPDYTTAMLYVGSGPRAMGDLVSEDDVAAVTDIRMPELAEPVFTGSLAILFTHRFFRYFYYDFTNVARARNGLLEEPIHVLDVLAFVHTRALFRDRLSIPEVELEAMLSAGWFPFASLPRAILQHMREDAKLSPPNFAVTSMEVAKWMNIDVQQGMLSRWKGREQLSSHLPFIERALDRFNQEDYLSACALITSRLEGILRRLGGQSPTRRRQDALIRSITVATDSLSAPNLLPESFQRFLKRFYFKDFDESQMEIPFGRHSLSHGVVQADALDRDAFIKCFLAIDQIVLCTLV